MRGGRRVKIPNIPEPLRKYGAMLLIVLAGLLLILWPKGAGPPEAELPGTIGETFELAVLEDRLEKILSSINGAGRVNVLLTLKTDMEVVVVQDVDTRIRRDSEGGSVSSSDDERRAKTVLAGAAPIIQKRIYPEFLGALIVCDGADNALVHTAILDAVAALTGLGADSITVAKRSRGA
jgi:stage III sporulation protein AG